MTNSSAKPRIPGYLLHKSTGQARVRINGQDFYLGEYGTPASRVKYGELIAQFASGLPIDPFAVTDEDNPLVINELVLAYLKHCETYYVKEGKVTAEYSCIKSALKPVTEIYGDTPVDDFGPLMMKAVRQKMIDGKDRCRRYINMSIGRIRRCWRWGVENEMVEPGTLQKLEAVAPLLAGRTEAKDYEPRHPITPENIALVRNELKQHHRDILDLCLLTGSRPGEICMLSGQLIDRSGDVWVAKLVSHKMVHKNKQRTLYFGPQSQLILRRYLTDDATALLFKITRASVSNAIKRVCKKLDIKKWTLHWARHTKASQVRENYGLDVAQVLLGHSAADVTQIYAQADTQKALKVARDAG
jgi:integrase